LHDGVLVGLALLATGFDPRAAVLPSLIGYAGTAITAWWLVWRLGRDDAALGSLLGATLAAVFVLVSPSGRAFATDVMIEGPGACVTLIALCAAVRAEQQPSAMRW